jgi:hypothetical protein
MPATADCADGVKAMSSVSASRGTARMVDFFMWAGVVVGLSDAILPGTKTAGGIIPRTDAGASIAIHPREN